MKIKLKILLAVLSFVSFSAKATCIGSTTGAALQTAINTAGGAPVILCQQAQIAASDQINLPSNTTIYTDGKPADSALWARIYYVTGTGLVGGSGHQALLAGYGQSYVNLSYIIVDGSRTAMSIEANTDDAHKNRTNIAIGGTGSVIDHVRVLNTIGSEAIGAADDPACTGLTITNSFVGYSGFYGLIGTLGQWADGIDVYCSNSNISNNEVRDATDGGITLYGGTNTTISYNWLASSGRNGISALVAAAVQKNAMGSGFYGFAGSQMSNNLIQTTSTIHLHLAISAGARMWCNTATPSQGDCSYIDGLAVTSNWGSGNFGYGLVVAGMTNVSMTGNNLVMTPWDNPIWTGPLAKCARSATVTNWYVIEYGSNVTPNSQTGYLARPDLTGCVWYQ